MATYAVLGSTGNCGSTLIQNLLRSPDNKIHAYCRNQEKLYELLPEVVDNKQVQCFQGNICDVELMTECVRDTKAVFLVVSSNNNIPGCRLSQVRTSPILKSSEMSHLEGKLEALVKLESTNLCANDMIGQRRHCNSSTGENKIRRESGH